MVNYDLQKISQLKDLYQYLEKKLESDHKIVRRKNIDETDGVVENRIRRN